MHPFVTVFMAIWFCGVLGIGGTLSIASIVRLLFASQPRSDGDWWGAVIPLLMAGFGVVLVIAGRHLARNEAQFITDFLTRTLEATTSVRKMEPI